MTETVANYRWSIGEFVRAWEAGAFDHRVELAHAAAAGDPGER